MTDPDSPSRSVDASHRIELRLPADPFWMSPLRAFMADLAVRAEFDLDRVSDLALAVDEAYSFMLRQRGEGALWCRVGVRHDAIEVIIGAEEPGGAALDDTASTFALQVLMALADEVRIGPEEGLRLAVRFTLCRTPRGHA